MINRIETRYPYLRSLVTALRSGVAYHNAALPLDVRERIEDAVRDGELQVVVATTTLAEGVDLPFRFTLLADWLVPTQAGQRPMDPLLFRNIAGRSGRAGWHTEGVTVIVDNPVGDPALVAPQTRRGLQRQVFAADELPPLTSVFDADQSTEEGQAISAAVSSNYLAAIPENPQQDDLASVLYGHSFAAVCEQPALEELLESSRSELMSGEGIGPLAVAASPLRLTAFGVAANATGLAPSTCRGIVAMLEEVDFSEMNPSQIAADVLERLVQVPEQTNSKLAKRLGGRKNRYPIESGDLEPLLEGWLAGTDEIVLFSGLGFVRRSKRKPPLAEWLAGTSESQSWPDVLDQFIDFRSVTLAGFLPWILRGCSSLATVVQDRDDSVDWSQLADFVETGTNNMWAATAVREGAPGGRALTIRVGQRLEDEGINDADDPLGLAVCRTSPTLVVDIFTGAVPETDELGDASALLDWLLDKATESGA